MKRTGIFFHYQMGGRLSSFPELLGPSLSAPNVMLCDAFYPLKPRSEYELDPVNEQQLLRVHSRHLIEEVKRSGYYLTAVLSAGGTVQAAERIWRGDIDNAFVFTGVGDHHSGRDFFGGWCYLNGAAAAIAELRSSYGACRFAIVDTDAHHGDGTWDIFKDDGDMLYVCFCGMASREVNGKVNVHVPDGVTDAAYLRLMEEQFVPRARLFRPEAIFWNWGYDGTTGEYGDMGLSPDVHRRLACLFKSVADEVCQGRLVVVLCGGHSREVADYAIPQVINCLAGLEQPLHQESTPPGPVGPAG
ncbi:MAG: hypothetical protein HYX87_08715 [Chloroflexi bacterium]|nr:hypothetical protein [Chloroflexota bacterium]